MPAPSPDPNRRSDRLIVPPCPQCGSYEADVETRAQYVLYVRCPRCRLLFSVPKPAFDPDVPPGR